MKYVQLHAVTACALLNHYMMALRFSSCSSIVQQSEHSAMGLSNLAGLQLEQQQQLVCTHSQLFLEHAERVRGSGHVA